MEGYKERYRRLTNDHDIIIEISLEYTNIVRKICKEIREINVTNIFGDAYKIQNFTIIKSYKIIISVTDTNTEKLYRREEYSDNYKNKPNSFNCNTEIIQKEEGKVITYEKDKEMIPIDHISELVVKS